MTTVDGMIIIIGTIGSPVSNPNYTRESGFAPFTLGENNNNSGSFKFVTRKSVCESCSFA